MLCMYYIDTYHTVHSAKRPSNRHKPSHPTNLTTIKQTMKIATTLALLAAGQSAAFLSPTTPLTHHHRSPSSAVPSSLLYAQQNDESFDADITTTNNNAALLTRRSILSSSLLTSSALLLLPTFTSSTVANADDASSAPTVVVAGATGQTGRRILERLASQPNISVIGGVRNVDKANKELSESSTVVRGAMIQKVPSLSAAGLELRKLDGTFVLCSHYGCSHIFFYCSFFLTCILFCFDPCFSILCVPSSFSTQHNTTTKIYITINKHKQSREQLKILHQL